MNLELTFDLLPVVAALLSVVGFFLPSVSKKYNDIKPDAKQLIYAGIIVLAGIGAALLSYFGFVNIYSGETWQEWVWYPAIDIVVAFLTSAGVYKSFNYVADNRLPKKK